MTVALTARDSHADAQPARPAAPPGPTPPPAVAAPTPAAPTSAAARTVEQHLHRARTQLATEQLAPAQQAILAARRAAGTDAALLDDVATTEATLRAYRGDLEGASQLVLDRLASPAPRASGPGIPWLHNRLIHLRDAMNDPAGMLAETFEMCVAGERPGYAHERVTEYRLDCLWHRAHSYRAYAQGLAGTARRAALRYAHEARTAFAQLARSAQHSVGSIVILDAYFATLDGDRAAALAAARQVDVAHGDDAQDLYITAQAFAAGGETANAQAAYARIRALPVDFLHPLYLRRIDQGPSAAPTTR